MQPQNATEWNLRYELAKAIESGAKVSLDHLGNIVIEESSTRGYPLLVEQTTLSGIADGKRRGFNGKQPRTSDGISHPVTVRTADGRVYDFKRKTRTDRTVRITDRDLHNMIGATNDGNPNA